MSLIIKDSDTLATSETSSRPGSAAPGDPPTRPQPVALEVPVAVNGARTVEGGDKREPFSEATKTVMIHGNGAVIKLHSALAPGQLLFLTNERTKKEVVCQVVKSKNYRSVSGYVELEFTEPAVGFWGMRFPGDRVVTAPPPAPAAPQPLPPKAKAPAPIVTPRIPETKPAIPAAITTVPATPAAPVAPARANPEVPVNAAPENSIEPSFPIVDPSRGADAKAFIIAAQPETAPLLSTLDE